MARTAAASACERGRSSRCRCSSSAAACSTVNCSMSTAAARSTSCARWPALRLPGRLTCLHKLEKCLKEKQHGPLLPKRPKCSPRSQLLKWLRSLLPPKKKPRRLQSRLRRRSQRSAAEGGRRAARPSLPARRWRCPRTRSISCFRPCRRTGAGPRV